MKLELTVTIDDNEVLNLIERLRECACLFADETYAVEDVRKALEKFIQNEAEAITADLDHYAHEIHQKSELKVVCDQRWIDEANFRWSDPFMAQYASSF